MKTVQGALTSAQAFTSWGPFGPFIVSPIKVCVSIIQIVGHLALAIIFASAGVGSGCAGNTDSGGLFSRSVDSLGKSFEGWGHLVLSLLNLATLGISGSIYNSTIGIAL